MRRFILVLLLALTPVLVPSTAVAQPAGLPAPDAFANVPEPGESPGNQEAPEKKTSEDSAKKSAVPGAALGDSPNPPVKEPENVVEAIEDVSLLVEAAKNGNWVLFTGLLIMLLIFLLDKVVKLKDKLPKNAVPWVAAAMGILGSIAAQLTTGIPWGQALLQGFMAGAVAVGLWELIFKAVLKKKDSAPAEPDSAETIDT